MNAARKALNYYGRFVRELNCWGTPMDTWKAVDEEGNIAFLKTCAILWRDTKDQEILELFKNSAEYEYLWRFGYATKPEYPPIRGGWSSCGGSVTSVSNPHPLFLLGGLPENPDSSRCCEIRLVLMKNGQ